MKHSKKGFTFLELLLVVFIVSFMGYLASIFAANLVSRNYLQDTTNDIIGALRTAHVNALSGKNDCSWGATLDGQEIVVFCGFAYWARDTVQDTTTQVPAGISVPTFEIVFEKDSGEPSSTLDISISDQKGDSKQILVNQMGTVDEN